MQYPLFNVDINTATVNVFLALFAVCVSIIMLLGILRLEKRLYTFLCNLYTKQIQGSGSEAILLVVFVFGIIMLSLNFFCYINDGIMGGDNVCYQITNNSADMLLSVKKNGYYGYMNTSNIDNTFWINNKNK